MKDSRGRVIVRSKPLYVSGDWREPLILIENCDSVPSVDLWSLTDKVTSLNFGSIYYV